MISNKNPNVANAVGGKTARACDSCIRKRARWYCAADDAFLCQSCDGSVHSANPLARRHERVRLKTASLLSLDLVASKVNQSTTVPSWGRGFTKKARTPRHGKPGRNPNPIPLVPEVGSDEVSDEEIEEEQLLYRVPIYEPFVVELCNSTAVSPNEAGPTTPAVSVDINEVSPKTSLTGGESSNLHGFLPSDMDLAEFAADVESLLGQGLENESFGMEELGLVDCKEELKESQYLILGNNNGDVKVEEEESSWGNIRVDCTDADVAREPPFELSFDYDSPATCGEKDEKPLPAPVSNGKRDELDKKRVRKKRLLSLDYEAVIRAWGSHGCSPWTTGRRPEFDADECWPGCMGYCGAELHHGYGDHFGGAGGFAAVGDGGREARVSRYREKRRTRLFSKKIRYEVRKLNAEKRPRMKGRFVKRTNSAGATVLPNFV